MCTGPLAPDALISSMHIRLNLKSLDARFPYPEQTKPDHGLLLMNQGQWTYNKNISSKLLFQLSLGAQHFMRIHPLSAWLEQSKIFKYFFFKLWTRSCPNKNINSSYIKQDMRIYLYIFLFFVWSFMAFGSYALLYDIPLFTL